MGIQERSFVLDGNLIVEDSKHAIELWPSEGASPDLKSRAVNYPVEIEPASWFGTRVPAGPTIAATTIGDFLVGEDGGWVRAELHAASTLRSRSWRRHPSDWHRPQVREG